MSEQQSSESSNLINLPIDIEAAIQVIKERNKDYDSQTLDRYLYDLSNVDLSHNADFSGADLSKFNLSDSVFDDAIFDKAKFVNTNLVGSHLINADLRNADLRYAELKDAHLTGAELYNADLSSAKGLTQKQINSAKGDSETKLPVGSEITRPEFWPDSPVDPG